MAGAGEDTAKLPDAVRRCLEKAEPAKGPEHKLWRTVVVRAILDAFGVTGLSDTRDHEKAIRAARCWFKFQEHDVETVFDFADYDYETVRSLVLSHKITYSD
jgi:hypothetical protein